MSDIGQRHWEIEKARGDKMRELMEQYDEEVYYPAIKALRKQCVAEYGEHHKTRWHDNGLGWGWWYCGRCGAAHGEEKL